MAPSPRVWFTSNLGGHRRLLAYGICPQSRPLAEGFPPFTLLREDTAPRIGAPRQPGSYFRTTHSDRIVDHFVTSHNLRCPHNLN